MFYPSIISADIYIILKGKKKKTFANAIIKTRLAGQILAFM